MSFETRLEEVYERLETDVVTDKLVIPNPNIEISTTNTYWHNVKDFLRKVKRPPKHFIDFLAEQLGTEVTQKTSKLSDGLILIKKHKKQKIVQLIEKYINENVLCKYCHSYQSKIKLDPSIRRYILTCNNCQASYSI
jgi:translation initiation factor 2 beta subunit (eIF-2beta)/eIF-5